MPYVREFAENATVRTAKRAARLHPSNSVMTLRIPPGSAVPSLCCCSTGSMAKSTAELVWLRDVPGLDGLENSICCATDASREQSRVALLFPGDIMDERAAMPSDLRQFSFEDTALGFLTNDESIGSVIIIQSAKRLRETACFTNFVDVASEGFAADYNPDGHSTEHLYKLLANVSGLLRLEAIPRIILAGFSRGGVVINQMITELARRKRDEFWSLVDEVRWIDTGNSPERGAFPLDVAASQKFAEIARRQPIKVLITGSPYQWRNQSRPSTLIERRNFVEILRPLLPNPHLVVRYHFADRIPNLHDHFAMLIDHIHAVNGVDITKEA